MRGDSKLPAPKPRPELIGVKSRPRPGAPAPGPTLLSPVRTCPGRGGRRSLGAGSEE
jgi:hypothetical protein